MLFCSPPPVSYSFTAPAETPITRNLERQKYKITIGTAINTDPAAKRVNSVSSRDVSPTATVHMSLFLSSIFGRIKSLQGHANCVNAVYEDIPFLIQKAVLELERPKKCYMIYDSCSNSNYEDFVLTLPENIFPLRHREITPSVLSQLEDGSVIIVGGFLASALLAKFPADLKKRTCAIISEKEQSLIPSDIHCLINNDDKKANVTINIVVNYIGN